MTRARRYTALVTGANRGIGAETARQLAARGLNVVIGARQLAQAQEVAAAVGGEALELDVGVADGVAAAAADLAARGVAIDVLVNNAGVLPAGGVLDAEWPAFEQAFAVNFFGALSCCRAFVPGMLARGYGRVVNVSSGWGSLREGLSSAPAAYGVSKAALNALTVRLAAEVSGDIKVNAVCPGWVRTRMGGPQATRSVEQGAAGVVWAATLPADGPNGGFFRDGKPVPW